jgi:phage I-like protein
LKNRRPLNAPPEVLTSWRPAITLSGTKEAPAPPTEFRLFENGVTKTLKGDFTCNAGACLQVLEAMRKHGRDKLPIDYNHGQVAWMGGEGKAAGWFVPASRNGELWATEVEWTPAGAQSLLDREYRLYSPAFITDDKGNVKELINVALTNLPATLNQTPLAAGVFAEGEESKDMTLEQLLAAFGAADAVALNATFVGLQTKNTALVAANAALTATNAEQATKLSAAETQVVALTAKASTAARDALIATLSAAGKLPPAYHSWAATQTLSQLEAYGAVAQAVASVASTPVTAPVTPQTTLSADELVICKQMQIEPAEFLKTKIELGAKTAADPHIVCEMPLPRFVKKAVA